MDEMKNSSKRLKKLLSNKKIVGNACRNIRIESGMTMEEFAEFSGVSRQTVNNFETGKHTNLDLFMKYYALAYRDNPEV